MSEPAAKTLRGDRCRCSGCGEYFNSTAAFDKHRVGREAKERIERRCLTVAEMLDRGMGLNAAEFWCTELRISGDRHLPATHHAGEG